MLVALLVAGILYLGRNKKKLSTHEVFSLAKEIETLWKEGGEVVNCHYLPKGRSYDSDYLRCNPFYLQCIFEQWEKEKRLTPIKNEDGLYFSSNGKGIISIALSKEHELQLVNQCHEVTLPPNEYVYFKADGKQVRFNVDYDLKIDRYLVNFKDIWLWKKERAVKPEFLSYPAVGLTAKEMEDYCQSAKKELVSAEHFIAASTHQEINPKFPKDPIIMSPYIWSRKKEEGPLFEAQYGKKFRFYESLCETVVTRECDPLKYFTPGSRATISVHGVSETMGGIFEYQKNSFEPERNLKASSIYFKFESLWHQLQKRAHWDGLGFELINFKFINFNFGDVGTYQEIPEPVVINKEVSEAPFWVGFRCMKRGRKF